ncbi:MAG: hypothetical protein NTY86_18980 [Deltaproteobacteria bacterium]|nr:hypothetical protein [Deltaproteobacteria bacterium]
MKWKITDPQICLNLISVIILLVGLGSAALIYQTAGDDSNKVLGYEIIGGQAYPILYGGKASVLTDEFSRWFVGLWQGKSLAFTISYITLFVFFVVFYFANHLPSNYKSSNRE